MTRELSTGATGAGVGAGATLTGGVVTVVLSAGLSDALSREALSVFELDSACFDWVGFDDSLSPDEFVLLSATDCCVTGSRDGGGASRFSGIEGGTGCEDATVAAGVAGLGFIAVESSVPEAVEAFGASIGRPGESLIVKS